MVAVFVTFRFGEGFDAEKVRQIANASRAKFEGVPGLRSKLFSIDAERKEARNVYVWSDAQVARAFFTEETRRRVAAIYGVEPQIEYAEVAALVENK